MDIKGLKSKKFSENIIRSFTTDDNLLHIGVYDANRQKLFLVRDGKVLDTWIVPYKQRLEDANSGKVWFKDSEYVKTIYDGEEIILENGLNAYDVYLPQRDEWQNYGISEKEMDNLVEDRYGDHDRFSLSHLQKFEADYNRVVRIRQLVNKDSRVILARQNLEERNEECTESALKKEEKRLEIRDKKNSFTAKPLPPDVYSDYEDIVSKDKVAYIVDGSKKMCKIGAFRQVCKAHFDESAGTRIPDIKVVQLRRMTDWNGEVRGFVTNKYVALDDVILEKEYPFGTFEENINIGTKGLSDYKIIEDYQKEILKLKGFNDKKFDKENKEEIDKLNEMVNKDEFSIYDLCIIYRKQNRLNSLYSDYASSKYDYSEIEKLNEEKEKRERINKKKQNDENILDSLFSLKDDERTM